VSLRLSIWLLACGCAAHSTNSGGDDLATPEAPADLATAPDLAGADLSSAPDLLPPPLVMHSILPSATDPAIANPDDPHLTWAGGPGNGLLLIFLPGTGGKPAGYTQFLAFAASTGYHVIGLDYPNQQSSDSVCGDTLGCYTGFRSEIWSGSDTNATLAVNADNCIHNRLVKLLGYLVANHPGEGWDPFFYMGEPGWNKITLSGHSQGGGHAAYVSTLNRVARVAMFSAPTDASATTTPPTAAAWASTHVTPSDRYFGFDHVQDAKFHDQILSVWTALGMDGFGALADVDQTAAPYAGTHELSSSRTLSSPHNQIVNNSTPLANGVPVYLDAWRYLIGP
jgi:hypothetical protein